MGWLSDLFGTAGNTQQLSNIAAAQQGVSGQELALAQGAQQTGQTLENPLLTGTLPPAAQALVSQTLKSNMANLRNQFSNLGLGGGSTMQATGENEARLASLAQTFGIEEDMFKLGLASIQEALGGFGGAEGALSGASGTVNDIANLNLTETGDLMNAIASFGGAMGKAMVPGKPS
jgi:hypothetical protein